jgi:hypothetical protein
VQLANSTPNNGCPRPSGTTHLEITTKDQQLEQSRHRFIRDHIAAQWALADDFCTGSYDRHTKTKTKTKTKKLKDVDIFVVIDPDGPQGQLAAGTGKAAVDELVNVLSTRWSDVITFLGSRDWR